MRSGKTSRLLGLPREMIRRYFRDQVGRDAAELAYYLLFSLFPLIIFVNMVLSTLHLSADRLSQSLGLVLPPQASDMLSAYLAYIQGLDRPILLYSCLVLTVYAVSRAISSLLSSLARAHGRKHRGPLAVISSVLCAVLLLASVFVLLVLTTVSDDLLLWVGRYVDLPNLLIRLWGLLRTLVGPLYLFFVLTCLYALVGYGSFRFTQVMPGAGFAVVLWYLSTTVFSFYVNTLSRYSVLYGSLTAFMVLMLWLWLTGVVIILGGQLNHILADLSEREDTL